MDDGRLGASPRRNARRDFTRRGGTLEMIQLWVNLPAKDKSRPPGYQSMLRIVFPKFYWRKVPGRRE